jgi:hypothetical protein
MMMRKLIGLALLFPLVVSSAAYAQEGNKFALGGSFTARATHERAANGGQGAGLRWRIGHAKNGWGWHYGIDWYSLDIDQPVAGSTMELGELHIRPLMGGYGYTRMAGPVSLTADVIAGYALTTFATTSAARDAMARATGSSTDVQVGGTPVIKPEIEMWLDVSRRIGLVVNTGYMVARPRLTVPSATGSRTNRFHADALEVTIGTVYRLF